MLQVKNLVASVEEKTILKGLDLSVKAGEVHAIMGPNGAGKSTLGNVLSGRDGYEVEEGTAILDGINLFELEPEERACEGLFLAFQYPAEIAGISNLDFLRASYNSIRRYRNEPELSQIEMLKLTRAKCKEIGMKEDFLKRGVNEGFSGGEKKRNEILQMLLLEPKLCILDETDSGLDIDALQAVAEGVNSLRSEKRAFIVVTHYQRLLDYIVPDYVHILSDGKIVKTGDKTLAHDLENHGYDWVIENR